MVSVPERIRFDQPMIAAGWKRIVLLPKWIECDSKTALVNLQITALGPEMIVPGHQGLKIWREERGLSGDPAWIGSKRPFFCRLQLFYVINNR